METVIVARASELLAEADAVMREAVRNHLLNVYTTLTMALTAASFGGALAFSQQITPLTAFGSAICSIILGVLVISTPQSYSMRNRFFILLFSGFLFGKSLGPLVTLGFSIKETTILTAIMITAVVFGGFSLTSLFAPVGCYLQIGGICISGLLYLTIASIISMLFDATALLGVETFMGVLIFCGLVIYGTQAIVVKRLMGDEDFVTHALHLFLDATAIFRGVLVLLIRRGKRIGPK